MNQNDEYELLEIFATGCETSIHLFNIDKTKYRNEIDDL